MMWHVVVLHTGAGLSENLKNLVRADLYQVTIKASALVKVTAELFEECRAKAKVQTNPFFLAQNQKSHFSS